MGGELIEKMLGWSDGGNEGGILHLGYLIQQIDPG